MRLAAAKGLNVRATTGDRLANWTFDEKWAGKRESFARLLCLPGSFDRAEQAEIVRLLGLIARIWCSSSFAMFLSFLSQITNQPRQRVGRSPLRFRAGGLRRQIMARLVFGHLFLPRGCFFIKIEREFYDRVPHYL